jgi:hypothetical protein
MRVDLTMRSLILICSLSAACSSSNSSTSDPNSCATKGATYVNTFKETSSGGLSCGVQTSQVVNVSESGVVSSSSFGIPVSCASSQANGCTSENSDCSYAAGGMTCSLFTNLTFASDGSSLSGSESLECGSCSSMYSISGTRQ